MRTVSNEREFSIEERLASAKVKKTDSTSKFSWKKILAAILVALVIGLTIGYSTGRIPISGYEERITILQNQHQLLREQLNSLNTNISNLQKEENDSCKLLIGLQKEYDTTNTIYPNGEAEPNGGLKVPSTTIREGDVVWAFKTTKGSTKQWSMPLEAYTYYADRAEPTEYHHFRTANHTVKVKKMELLVQPELFSNVINDLTEGRNDRDFVQEVFNLRKQLTVYRKDTFNVTQSSVETLTKGTGDCEDFAILMGSLLESGNQHANYNMTVQMVYMDTNNLTNPQTINHVLLKVWYNDGTKQLVDSTSTKTLNPWPLFIGWFYDI